MRIVKRYLLVEIIKLFAGALIFFVGLMTIAQLFEKLNTLIDYKVSLGVTVRYFLFKIPFFLSQITPVAVLLATILSLGRLSRDNELTALETGGISIYQIITPALVVALAISLLSLFLNDLVVPYTNRRAKEIDRIEIHKEPTYTPIKKSNLAYRGALGRMFYIGYFDGEKSLLTDLIIFEYKERLPFRRLDIEEARWVNNVWHFKKGYFREFNEYGEEIRMEPFEELIYSLPETPLDFAQDEGRSGEMGLRELHKHIRKLQSSGTKVIAEMVDLHLKISLPFANFIFALLGIPFVLQDNRGGPAIGLGISLAVSFIYWGCLGIAQALGKNGVLPPLWAAWAPNILFGLIALILVVKARK